MDSKTDHCFFIYRVLFHTKIVLVILNEIKQYNVVGITTLSLLGLLLQDLQHIL